MNTTIDLKIVKTIDIMSQQISHMDNAVTDFFNKMSDVLGVFPKFCVKSRQL